MPSDTPSPASAPPAGTSTAEASTAGASTEEHLTDAELDAIADDLARAEQTLGLLADDDADPTAVAAWLGEPSLGEPSAEGPDDPAGAATQSSGAATQSPTRS